MSGVQRYCHNTESTEHSAHEIPSTDCCYVEADAYDVLAREVEALKGQIDCGNQGDDACGECRRCLADIIEGDKHMDVHIGMTMAEAADAIKAHDKWPENSWPSMHERAWWKAAQERIEQLEHQLADEKAAHAIGIKAELLAIECQHETERQLAEAKEQTYPAYKREKEIRCDLERRLAKALEDKLPLEKELAEAKQRIVLLENACDLLKGETGQWKDYAKQAEARLAAVEKEHEHDHRWNDELVAERSRLRAQHVVDLETIKQSDKRLNEVVAALEFMVQRSVETGTTSGKLFCNLCDMVNEHAPLCPVTKAAAALAAVKEK